MSHISTVAVEILDMECVERACQELGLEFRPNQKQYKTYGGQLSACEAAIVLPGQSKAYEAGVIRCREVDQAGKKRLVPDPKGDKLTIGYDAWNGGNGLMEVIGRAAGKLLQSYGKHVVKKQARKSGAAYREQVQADGSVKIWLEPREAKGYAKQW